MAVDLGNLQLGIEIPGLATLDRLEAQLAVMERTPHIITVNVDNAALRAGFGGAFQQEMAATAASTAQAEQAVASFTRTTASSAATIDTASVAMKGLEGNTKGVTTALLGIGGTAVGILAAGAAIGVAVKSAEQFQQTMANLQAVLHAPSGDFVDLGAGIQAAARTSVFSITEIAEADRQLAKAGSDTSAIMREQADVLNLASASNATAADAAAGMVTAQKSFGLTAKDSTMIADDLSRAVDSSVGTFADMTDALKQVGPVAQQAGMSLKETTTAIAALENAGLQGDSGTALKLFLQRLEDPSKTAQAAIHDLGLEVYDADGKMRSLADIADQLRLKTQGLSDEAKNADLSTIFGARGVRVADIFAQQGSDGLDAVTQHEAELGTAADIARTKLDTLSGQMKELKSSADTVAANFGGVLVPALSAAGSEFTDLFNSIAKLSGGLSDLGAAGKYGQQIADAIRGATMPAPGEQPFSADEQRMNLLREQKNLLDQIGQLQPGVDAAKGDIVGHLFGDDGGKAKLDQAKQGLAEVNAELAKLDPSAVAAQGLQKLSQEEANLANEFSHGRVSMDAALASAQAWAETAIRMGANTATVTSSLQDYAVALRNIANAQYEARYADEQSIAQEQQQAMKLLDEGAPGGLVTAALFGKRNGMDPAALVAAQDQLKEWEDSYKQSQEQVKAFAAEQADYFKSLDKATADAKKQAQQDAVKAQQDAIQKAGDAEVAAATKVMDAWKAAGTEVGRVDPAKGIQGLIDAAPGLDAARDALSALGQSDGALTDLTKLADVFQSWAADTDKANAALKGYDLTLAQTNKAIQGIGSLKSEYLAALDAAEKRQKAGTADASDIAIINARTTALAAFDQQTGKLQQQGNVDILGKLANLPDYAAINQNLKNVVTAQGGGAAVLSSLTADKAQASTDITQFAATWHDSIEKIKADTKDAKANVDAFLVGLPTDKTITIHYVTQDAPGSASTQQGNEGTAPSGTPAGWNQYMPLGESDYYSIVKQGAGGKTSPFADPAVYASVLAAAKEYGVDPRVLLAFTQMENNNGTNISPELVAANNFGGQKYVGQAGATQGPMSPEGDNYAAFPNADKFFETLAANLVTGQYAKFYQNGDLTGDRRTYVTGGATGTADQEANIANTVALYQRLAQQYPAAAGAGSGGVLPGYGPGDVGLGSGQNPTGGALNAGTNIPSSAIVDAAKKHLNEMTQVDGEPWYMWCEKFVDNQLQDVLGSTYRPHSAEQRIEDARNGVKGAGTIVSASQARAGDLVAWDKNSNYAGSADGHVGIYEGGGNYIGTTQKGIQERPIGPDAVFIRPDGVVAAGPEPGSIVHTTTPAQRAATGYGPGTYTSTGGTASAGVPPTSNVTGGIQQATVSAQQLTAALASVNAEFGKMDKASVAGTQAALQGILPALTESEGKRIFGDAGPLTDTEKQQAAAAGWQKALQYATAYAQLLQDIENHTGNLAADTQKVAEIVGGPMADAYGKAALASAQITAATSATATLTAAHDLTVAQRQLDDQAASRAATIAGWAEQDKQAAMQARQQAAQERLQDKQTAENDRYTRVSRDEQDRQRALQFSQQVEGTDLQNKLADLQKSQQNTTYNRTSQEQLQESSIRAAGTNQQASQGAAVLAGMHDRDLAQKDLDNKAIEGVQLQIREQAKQANLESYNLQTETIAEQRKHENIIANLTAQGVAQQRTFAAEQQAESQHQQQIQRSAQMQQWQLQDERAQEDAAYKSAIDAQTKIKDDAQASLDAANQALTAWQQTGQVVAAAASSASALASNGNPTNLGNTSSNVTAATFGQGGTYVSSHWSGGTIGMGQEGIVGDAPGGGITPYTERVKVTPLGATIVPLNAHPAGGGANTVNFNFGDMETSLSEQDKADIKAYVTDKIVASQRAGIKHKRAVGLG